MPLWAEPIFYMDFSFYWASWKRIRYGCAFFFSWHNKQGIYSYRQHWILILSESNNWRIISIILKCLSNIQRIFSAVRLHRFYLLLFRFFLHSSLFFCCSENTLESFIAKYSSNNRTSKTWNLLDGNIFCVCVYDLRVVYFLLRQCLFHVLSCVHINTDNRTAS